MANDDETAETHWYAKATAGATVVSMFAAAAGGVAASEFANLAPVGVDLIEAGSAVVGAGVGWYVGLRERVRKR